MLIIVNNDVVGFSKEEERAREISSGHLPAEGGEMKAINEQDE